MHETALCQSVVEIITDQARRDGFQRVHKVTLVIGALSHVEPEAMTFSFAAAAHGTIAEGAELDIERPPGKAWCMVCATEIIIEERHDPCPQCGGHQLVVTAGDEMRVRDLEVS